MPRYCINCDGVLSELGGDFYCKNCRCGGFVVCGFLGRGKSSPSSSPGYFAFPSDERRAAAEAEEE